MITKNYSCKQPHVQLNYRQKFQNFVDHCNFIFEFNYNLLVN